MASKFDDFLAKKKDSLPTLDFAKTIPTNDDDFRKMCDKLPDFKMKPERAKVENLKIQSKHFKFKGAKRAKKGKKKATFAFMDPLPNEMRKLNLNDFLPVSIDWRMLTTARPKTKLEEDFFSRIIELGKAELKTRASDKRTAITDPPIRRIRKGSGVPEVRVVSCKECEEDFCNGKTCTKFAYDHFARSGESVPIPVKTAITEQNKSKKKRSKVRFQRKSRSLSPRKTMMKDV